MGTVSEPRSEACSVSLEYVCFSGLFTSPRFFSEKSYIPLSVRPLTWGFLLLWVRGGKGLRGAVAEVSLLQVAVQADGV